MPGGRRASPSISPRCELEAELVAVTGQGNRDAARGEGKTQGLAPQDHAHFERLRRRLRWQILGAYVVPLVLASAYFHCQHSSTLRRDADAHLRSIADNQRNTVDLFYRSASPT